jgi:hypothetical protein
MLTLKMHSLPRYNCAQQQLRGVSAVRERGGCARGGHTQETTCNTGNMTHVVSCGERLADGRHQNLEVTGRRQGLQERSARK